LALGGNPILPTATEDFRSGTVKRSGNTRRGFYTVLVGQHVAGAAREFSGEAATNQEGVLSNGHRLRSTAHKIGWHGACKIRDGILQAMEVIEATRAKKTTNKQAVRESLGRSLTGSSS
jgi:hypothetical protein